MIKRFSALQRAENSSIRRMQAYASIDAGFQCSSASRKFLNFYGGYRLAEAHRRFSALQRAENSSIALLTSYKQRRDARFSALQRAENSSMFETNPAGTVYGAPFQCSSASRKFLNQGAGVVPRHFLKFQCSSASRKFLNSCVDLDFYILPGFQCSSASRKFLNRPTPVSTCTIH